MLLLLLFTYISPYSNGQVSLNDIENKIKSVRVDVSSYELGVIKLKQSVTINDAVNFLPRNYVVDGSIDYTSYIQEAINQSDVVFLPDFPVLINDTGLILRSDMKLIFKDKSELFLKPNNKPRYNIISLIDINNVLIYKPKIKGDRNTHLGKNGEWGMGIYIIGSSNITIVDANISNCWGDGIYIGGSSKNSSNLIKLINPVIDNARRNGISITSGTNIQILSPIVSNTNGTLPMFGIDIEPNNSNDLINHIDISNPVTFNNKGGGILIGLNKMIKEKTKDVNISILNHYDEGSEIGFRMGGISNSQNVPVTGKIIYKEPTWVNNVTPFKYNSSGKNIPILYINSPKIITPIRKAFTLNELQRILKGNKNIKLR